MARRNSGADAYPDQVHRLGGGGYGVLFNYQTLSDYQTFMA